MAFSHLLICEPLGLLQESLGPFAPKLSRECPSGCLWGPLGPGLQSVPKVSPECPWSVRKVFGPRDTPRQLPEHFGPEGPERLLQQAGGFANQEILLVRKWGGFQPSEKYVHHRVKLSGVERFQ